MKDRFKKFLLFSSALMPLIVFASNGNNIDIEFALMMEAFVSIHMSVFVLKPLSKLISEENSNKIFWILFAIRALILLYFDFFVTTGIVVVDFLSIFVGAVIVGILSAIKGGKNYFSTSNPRIVTSTGQINDQIFYRCAKCGTVINTTDLVCPKCGEVLDPNYEPNKPPKVSVSPSNFDNMFSLDEDTMLEECINRELRKAGVDITNQLIPENVLRRKMILNIMFCALVCIYISLIFFHFPIYTYIIGLIILLILFKVTRKYNLIKDLKKQIKARPNEKITNIVMSVSSSFVKDTSRGILGIGFVLAIILPLVIFIKPRIIYEKVDGGYAVRYYAFGITDYKMAVIPETYKNEKVVSLRGNTFSNMFFLNSVVLPDSIKEIRGQAFKNCINLADVNIPKNLEYLGGGAFYNASSIMRIELPDTLTYLGGESFYHASSLAYIKLSNNLTEIRGNTFEYCSSLRSITIPDKVTRIGGHAFYGDSSLSEVIISPDSNLTEIGSSAFRQCSRLYEISLPHNTNVNYRAFKESPTVINRY